MIAKRSIRWSHGQNNWRLKAIKSDIFKWSSRTCFALFHSPTLHLLFLSFQVFARTLCMRFTWAVYYFISMCKQLLSIYVKFSNQIFKNMQITYNWRNWLVIQRGCGWSNNIYYLTPILVVLFRGHQRWATHTITQKGIKHIYFELELQTLLENGEDLKISNRTN